MLKHLAMIQEVPELMEDVIHLNKSSSHQSDTIYSIREAAVRIERYAFTKKKKKIKNYSRPIKLGLNRYFEKSKYPL